MKKRALFSPMVLWLAVLLISGTELFAQIPPSHLHQHNHSVSYAEKLWGLVEIEKIKQEVITEYGILPADEQLFFNYCQDKFSEIRQEFFKQAGVQPNSESSIVTYSEKIKALYLEKYPEFTKVKSTYEKKFNINRLAAINTTCYNSNFENGNLSGWEVATADACRKPRPCNIVNGAHSTRHFITNPTTIDPYIPGLSTVAPGGTYSLRLENYANGGDASIARYTFPVTANSSLFTYKYAVVLEDPGDHDDDERPYFKVNMFDQYGNNISCGNYSVLAKPPLQDFTLVQTMGSNGLMDLYYRDWTTVSIPLNTYIGQNITIEFIVSDCTLGGHLGYAYIEADCAKISPEPTKTICGSETGKLTASPGFASYKWSGPGIVGPSNSQTITVNKAGTYSVLLTPFADNPCPVTMSVDVMENCPVDSVALSICETIAGTGKATGVNLNNYTSQVTAINSPPGNLVSWHSGKPASAANLISSVSNLTIPDNSRLYAIITVNGSNITVTVNFDIIPLPVITFPSIPVLCAGTSTHQITGVTPAGGTYSGSYVSASGLITPSAPGSYTINYTYLNSQGCSNEAQAMVEVMAPATVDAGTNQVLCENNAASINLSGTSGDIININWSGGAGTFNNNSILNPIYTPSEAEIASGTIVFTLTGKANSPCPNVSDQVTVMIVSAPEIEAGDNHVKCSNNVSSINLNASVSNVALMTWSGGTGSFSFTDKASTQYTPSDADIAAGAIIITLTAKANEPCANVTDQLTLTFVPAPEVNAGSDQTLCANTDKINLTGSSNQTSSLIWTGGKGKFIPDNSTATATYLPTAEEVQQGKVVLVLTGTGNDPCANTSDEIIVTIHPLPVVNLEKEYKFCGDDTNPFTIIDAGPHHSYHWYPTGDTTQTITVNYRGIYQVTVTNEFNCSATDETHVREVCPPRVFLSNAFSPNDDGANDIYTVYGEHVGKFEMVIFNRWGEVIFKSDNLENAWNGIYREEVMPFGVYAWIITYEGDTEEYKGPYKMEGSVTLLK